MTEARRTEFPPIAPYATFRLPVGDGHELYIEESGNPDGLPVVFLHGGPGDGFSAVQRQYFDPHRFRVILFDQRGCGQSTPFASLQANTTWDLVADIERIREHLRIDRWAVFGGSWGSTLALAYAETHPRRVDHLVLRGSWLLTQEEVDWLYLGGAGNVFPTEYMAFLGHIPAAERTDLLAAYHRRLTSDDAAVRLAAAKAWSIWEGSLLSLHTDASTVARFSEDTHADAIARIECHYIVNRGFFDTDEWLLQNAHELRGISGVLVHGQYDMIVPLRSSWRLHQLWPESELIVVPDAGHQGREPGILDALIRALEAYADSRTS